MSTPTAAILFYPENNVRVIVPLAGSAFDFCSGALDIPQAWCFVRCLPKSQSSELKMLQELVEAVRGTSSNLDRLGTVARDLGISTDDLLKGAGNCKSWPVAQDLQLMIDRLVGQQRKDFLAMLSLAIRRKELNDPEAVACVEHAMCRALDGRPHHLINSTGSREGSRTFLSRLLPFI